MPTPSKLQILNQFHSLQQTGFFGKLKNSATAHGLPVPYFFAIASRETNCINELGDFQHGEFHGVGIVQIDIQHGIAREARDSGTWKTNPGPLIDFGAQILVSGINQTKGKFPAFSEQQALKIAASGYNAGMTNAFLGADHGDSDRFTTGHDYGRDVMTRMAIFEELIAENA